MPPLVQSAAASQQPLPQPRSSKHLPADGAWLAAAPAACALASWRPDARPGTPLAAPYCCFPAELSLPASKHGVMLASPKTSFSSAGDPRSAHKSLPTLFLNSDLMTADSLHAVRAACLLRLMCAAEAAALLALSCTVYIACWCMPTKARLRVCCCKRPHSLYHLGLGLLSADHKLMPVCTHLRRHAWNNNTRHGHTQG